MNVSGTTKLNGATTCISTLNVIGNIIGSGTALTNLNYNSILNPPTIPNFNGPCTLVSSLFVSGSTCLSTFTIASQIIVGNNNSIPNLQLGSTNGNNYGVASTHHLQYLGIVF